MASLFHDLQALIAVQAVDSRIDRARAALAALDTGAKVATTYNKGKAEYDKLKAAMVHAQAEQHDAEMRLQSIEDKTAQVNTTLYGGTVTAAREIQNIQKELDMLGRQKSDAEEKVLVAMEEAATATAAADGAEAELRDLAARHKEIRAAFREQSAALNAEIAALEAERATAATPVPAPLLARYDLIRSKKNGIGAALLQPDGTCGACHIKLNSTLVEDINTAATVQLCEHCARILVPPFDFR